MFGRFGWAEILVVVVLVLILFGHNKIPGMMKNLADGLNIFKKELKGPKGKNNAPGKPETTDAADNVSAATPAVNKLSGQTHLTHGGVKKAAKKSVSVKSAPKKAAVKSVSTKGAPKSSKVPAKQSTKPAAKKSQSKKTSARKKTK